MRNLSCTCDWFVSVVSFGSTSELTEQALAGFGYAFAAPGDHDETIERALNVS